MNLRPSPVATCHLMNVTSLSVAVLLAAFIDDRSKPG